MTTLTTLGAQYFDDMYEQAADPWGFESRWYERRKYALTMALLPRERYRSAFEPGCSVGVLTSLLAQRCDRLLACDLADAAVAAARERTQDRPNVRVEQGMIPRDWPAGSFDLIALSEVLYYLGNDDLEHALRLAIGSLTPGGTIIAVHWRHPVPEYPRTGDDVHKALAQQPQLARAVRHREADFIAEVFTRTDGDAPQSVAQATGLV